MRLCMAARAALLAVALLLAAALYLLLPTTTSSSENYLNETHTQTIGKLMPIYEQAAVCAGIPAAMLAAIHYREAELKIGHNVGGPFMMDAGGSGKGFAANIRAREITVARYYNLSPVPRVRDDFAFAALCAAHHCRLVAPQSLLKAVENGDDPLLWDVAYTLWGYNGRARWHRNWSGQHSWRGSSYVANHPHRGRTLLMRYRQADRTVVEFQDARAGTLVLYQEINSLKVIPSHEHSAGDNSKNAD